MIKRKRLKPDGNIAPLLWFKPQVMAAIGVDHGTLERYMRRPDFPARVVMSKQKKGWRPEDIRAWIESRKEKRYGAR